VCRTIIKQPIIKDHNVERIPPDRIQKLTTDSNIRHNKIINMIEYKTRRCSYCGLGGIEDVQCGGKIVKTSVRVQIFCGRVYG